MPQKAKNDSAAKKLAALEKAQLDQGIDLRVEIAASDEEVAVRSADAASEKTVVFKNTNGDYEWCHLGSDGKPWVHGDVGESKDDTVAKAQLAYPAWPVEVVKDNPWLPSEEGDEDE